MAPLYPLEENINKTEECRKDIINKINNKLGNFIPSIPINTPLSKIDEKLDDFNINNSEINSSTFYVIRAFDGRPGTNLIGNIDPRIDNIETTSAAGSTWAKFRYISKYSVKASAIVSYEAESSNKPYLKITDKNGKTKLFVEETQTYSCKIIDDITINQYDTIEMRTNGGYAWFSITSITLHSVIPYIIPILTLDNLNGSNDLTKDIQLTTGKYRIIASSGAGSGMESENTYDSKVWYKAATGGNGANCTVDLTVHTPTLNISCICGKRGGVNNNQPFISGTKVSSGYSAGSKINGGNTIIKINNVDVINLSGGKYATVGSHNSSDPGEGGTVTISDTYKDYINVISSHNGNKGIGTGSNSTGAYITATANSSGVLTINGNKYGYAGSVSTGRSGTNPTGGYIQILQII